MRPLLVWLREPEVSAWELLAARGAGLDAVLLRRPGASAETMRQGVLCARQAGLAAIVSDRLDVALAMGSACQLRHDSLPPSLARKVAPALPLGASVHDEGQVLSALEAGVDYLVYGHVFATPSKAGLPPRGITALAGIAAMASAPVLAIGGLTPGRVGEVLVAGAVGVVVRSGIRADRAAEDVARLREALDGAPPVPGGQGRNIREVLGCASV